MRLRKSLDRFLRKVHQKNARVSVFEKPPPKPAPAPTTNESQDVVVNVLSTKQSGTNANDVRTI